MKMVEHLMAIDKIEKTAAKVEAAALKAISAIGSHDAGNWRHDPQEDGKMTAGTTSYEPATVDRVRKAKVGDWLWIYDEERTLRDHNGNYLGRGDFCGRYQVMKVSRKYLTVQVHPQLQSGSDFEIETGQGRSERGYSSRWRAMGHQDVEDFLVTGKRHVVQKAISSASADQLRKIAGILDIDL